MKNKDNLINNQQNQQKKVFDNKFDHKQKNTQIDLYKFFVNILSCTKEYLNKLTDSDFINIKKYIHNLFIKYNQLTINYKNVKSELEEIKKNHKDQFNKTVDEFRGDLRDFKYQQNKKLSNIEQDFNLKFNQVLLKLINNIDTLLIIKSNISKEIDIQKYKSDHFVVVMYNAIVLLLNDFYDLLKIYNVEEIIVKIDQTLFDSKKHSALSINTIQTKKDCIILGEFKKGYIRNYNEEQLILRKSIVLVNKIKK